MSQYTRRSILKTAALAAAAAPLAMLTAGSVSAQADALKDAKAKAAAAGDATKKKAAAASDATKKKVVGAKDAAAAKLKLASPAEGTAKALGYVEKAADAAKACDKCNFYKATEAGNGTCMLIAGFLVKGAGSCNSFVKKA
jgi:hypothetical protein